MQDLSGTGIGLYNIITFEPSVFAAVSPHYAVRFFIRNGFDGWRMLGGILLCVTGTEAMFADLGHFSIAAIQVRISLDSLLPSHVFRTTYHLCNERHSS